MASRQNKNRFLAAIATRWKVREALPPACTSCGVEFPLKSNIGIVEEIERLASYLSPPAPLCCPNQDCANHAGRIPAGVAGAYASFGKTAIGNPRWRCNVCGKTFSQNLKATARAEGAS